MTKTEFKDNCCQESNVPWNIPPSVALSRTTNISRQSSQPQRSHSFLRDNCNSRDVTFDSEGKLQRTNSCPDIHIHAAKTRSTTAKSPLPRQTSVILAANHVQYKHHNLLPPAYNFYYNFDGPDHKATAKYPLVPLRYPSGRRKESVLRWTETELPITIDGSQFSSTAELEPRKPKRCRVRLPRQFNECDTRQHAVAPSLESSFRKAFHNWAKDAEIHGVRKSYVCQPFLLRRLVWFLAVLASFAAVFYFVYLACAYYMTRPVSINIKSVTNDTIRFPAVTVCNQNAFKVTVAAQSGRYQLLSNMLMNARMENYSDFETDSLTLDDIYLTATHDVHDMVVRWNQDNCSHEDFEMTLSDFGVCYTFNSGSGGVLYSANTGVDSGLEMLVNIEQYEYMQGLHSGAGLKVLVHNQGDLPWISNYALNVFPGSHSQIAVQMLQTSYLKPPHGTCDDNRQLKYYSQYSATNCFSECRQLYIQIKCRCRDIQMPSTQERDDIWFPFCTLSQFRHCIVEENDYFQKNYVKLCDCPTPCKYESYSMSLDYGAMSHKAANALLYMYNNRSSSDTLSTLQEKYSTARDVTQRYLPSIIAKDVSDIQNFNAIVHRLKDLISHTILDLRGAIAIIDEIQTDLTRRVMFHLHLGLESVKQAVREKFISGWEAAKTEVFQSIRPGVQGLTGSMYRTFEQMRENANDTFLLDMLWHVWYDRIQVSLVNVDRTREIFEDINESFGKAQPIVPANITPSGWYDDVLLSPELTDIKPDTRELLRRSIVGITGKLNRDLRRYQGILSEYNATLFLDEKDMTRAATGIDENSGEFDLVMNNYQETIVYPVIETVLSRIADFVELNNTLFSYTTKAKEHMMETVTYLTRVNTTSVTKLLQSGKVLVSYISDISTRKSDIAEELSSVEVEFAIKDMERFFNKAQMMTLTSDDDLTFVHKSVGDIWLSICTDNLTHAFYDTLSQDLARYLDPSGTDVSEVASVFSSMLNINEEQLLEFDPDVLASVLNADISNTSIENKQENLLNTFNNLRVLANIAERSRHIEGPFQDLLVSIVQSLKDYRVSSDISADFITQNLLYISVYIKDLNIDRIEQTVAYDVLSILGDVGGSMGLFLGFSLLSLVGIFDALVHQGLRCCKLSTWT